MRNTTLCYIERGEQYLMLHRVKKEHDLNHDKWVASAASSSVTRRRTSASCARRRRRPA